MKKRLIFFACCLFGAASLWASCGRKACCAEKPWSKRMVEARGLGDFYMNRKHVPKLAEANWDYVTGLVANSVIKAWEQYPEEKEYYLAVKALADRCVTADGRIIKGGENETTAFGHSNIDDLAAGKMLFALYRHESAAGNTVDSERYRTALNSLRNELKFNHSRIAEGMPGAGGFFHKAIYPNQMWLDGLYMGTALYAQWQAEFGGGTAENDASWADIAKQFEIIHRYTYDPEVGLNYHAWSADPADPNSFWARQEAPFLGCSPEFWGRGMGWYFAALVDVLGFMPAEHPGYDTVRRIALQVAEGLARWQDPQKGTWNQLLRHGTDVQADGIGDLVNGKRFNVCDQSNYEEASCSAMFTYAFYKGVRIGLLDKELYLPIAGRAFDGFVSRFIPAAEDGSLHVIDVCASAGLGPASNPGRTGTVNYYICGKDVTRVENEGKAIGSFIMAALERELATQ